MHGEYNVKAMKGQCFFSLILGILFSITDTNILCPTRFITGVL